MTGFLTALVVLAATWLSVPHAPEADAAIREKGLSAPGTSWFVCALTNAAEIASARWTVSGLGVFEVYVNGTRVLDDTVLKPGFTHPARTRQTFSGDVASAMKRSAGEVNWLAAEVGSGWWRDKVYAYRGRKSAFCGTLHVTYADGREEDFGTNVRDWRCGVGGPVIRSGIFDGEAFDARIPAPVRGDPSFVAPEENREFAGELVDGRGAAVVLREDLAIGRGPFRLRKGETRVVDFGQNCAAVPRFRFASRRGTTLTALPAEMLNDADAGVRGCDGPKGSVYRANLRNPDNAMRLSYVFAGDGVETYRPRFTYFGYRYLALSATDDVEVDSVESVPVSSILPGNEIGTLETGDASVNRLVANAMWGLRSNYLSVPTDCPQRDERLGWAGDTQVFAETACYFADVGDFLRKWMRDMRDSRGADGGFASVAPTSLYGGETFNCGYADAGVIVPYRVWRATGDAAIVRENWEAMARFVRVQDETSYRPPAGQYTYADWLSCQRFETRGNAFGDWEKWRDDPDARAYREYLAACYWLWNAEMLAEMGAAIGRTDDAAFFGESASRARAHLRRTYLEEDGLLLRPMRDLQTACLFALKSGIVGGAAADGTKRILRESIATHGNRMQTGFLGTSVLMDTLTAAGMTDLAYALLLQHGCPGWLYSVDQGATTIWERWNSYGKEKGFGPVDMNSFNHYAYGSVVAWLFKTAAGIAPDPSAPGYARFTIAPKPDRRLGSVKASYRSAAGLIRSAWRYEGEKWTLEIAVPSGATAKVILPNGEERVCASGEHVHEVKDLK